MKKPDYFPVLNSLRFFASMCVFIAHAVAFYEVPGGRILWPHVVSSAGYYGVIFFYCLSGFLITFLLLNEKVLTGNIAIGNFYKRRALRIWPLYYLIVLLSFFVFRGLEPPSFGSAGWPGALLLFLFFLPNIAMLLGVYMPTCFHTYTIGFEEQFYLVWPLIVKKAGRRPVALLAMCFIAPLVIDGLHRYFYFRSPMVHGGPGRLINAIATFISYCNIPAFAAGCAGGYWYFGASERRVRELGGKRWTYLLLIAAAGLMYFGKPLSFGYVNLCSVVYILLILNLLTRKSGKGGLLQTGGAVSYAVYIYHPAVLLFVFNYFVKGMGLSGRHPLIGFVVYFVLSLVVVLVLSALSHRYIERPFLVRKVKYRGIPISDANASA
ncbi:MAG: acyltransferase [Bacteroidetes bacterium]|nr:acyltransferase [Bacteroidota bacterium]